MKRTASSVASSSSSSNEPDAKRQKTAATTTTSTRRQRKPPPPSLEGFLDITNCNSKLWLVKIPVPLATHWDEKAPESLLGSITIQQPTTQEKLIAKNTKKKPTPKISFTLNDDVNGVKEGTLAFSQPPPLYIMGIDTEAQKRYVTEQLKKKEQTEKNDGDDWASGGEEDEPKDILPTCLSVTGTVSELANLTPKIDSSYGRLIKQREVKSNTKYELMKQTDKDVVPALHQMNKVSAAINRASKQAEPKEKKARISKEELMPKIFQLFEKQPFWALKDLSDETQQPVGYLKEILEEICEYNRRGSNKGKYELKEQYKTTQPQEQQEHRDGDDWE
jgi:hypothetical protein